ncbi:MAG TPA: hypothetical protein GX692_04810 [Acholeplasmataceae bacterium]|nr:hypothetical protein [Acholeplasmataceae bacterium]
MNKAQQQENENNKNKEKAKDNSKIKIVNISAGIVSGYVGEYLENVFTNILNRETNVLKDNNEFEDYLVTIFQGGVEGLFEGRLSIFNAVVLATGLQYVLYWAFQEIAGKTVDNNFVPNFILDIFFIYLIILIYNYFQKNNEEEGFLPTLSENLETEILISLYYAVKTHILNKKSGNNSERVVENEK